MRKISVTVYEPTDDDVKALESFALSTLSDQAVSPTPVQTVEFHREGHPASDIGMPEGYDVTVVPDTQKVDIVITRLGF